MKALDLELTLSYILRVGRMKKMRIGEVSKLTDISTHTLRYYEKVGLIYPIQKDQGGIREYSEQDVSRLKFIKCMRGADVPIESLKIYIDLYDEGTHTYEERMAILKNEYVNMLQKQKDVEAGVEYLKHKIEVLEQNEIERKKRI